MFVLLVINLNIMPWNATGLISSASYLCDALKDKVVDICGISEHFLFPNNVHFLILTTVIMYQVIKTYQFQANGGWLKEMFVSCGIHNITTI